MANMTKKMSALYMDIIASLGQLPANERDYIFGCEGEEDFDLIHAVASFIVLEFIKYSYDCSDKTYPLRHFLQNVDDDSERMLQQRLVQYVLKHKEREAEIKGIEPQQNDKFAHINMDQIDNKLKGYRLTEMNYFELQNIHDLEIVKSIVERRIVSAKKIPNARFQEMFEQYDDFVESLHEQSKLSDKDMVFASLALFTLEWKYPIEFFYFLSCFMEEEGIDSVDQKDIALLCGFVNIESRFGGWYATESRFIKGRILLAPALFTKETEFTIRETAKGLVKEILVLITKYTEVIGSIDGGLYKDWFMQESTMEDWASFFRYYDVFSIWQRKEWTTKRIKKMRYLFDISILKDENPENRS